MIYLSGAVTAGMQAAPRDDLGFMANPWNGAQADGDFVSMPWAVDNGRFARRGRWDEDRWLGWLRSGARRASRCLFAVAPDVVGDAAATLALSLPYLPTIRQLGYKAAFVTQDGCMPALVPWAGIDALFVGGTDAWKLSEPSYALVREAKRRGLHAHMGRVNSLRRMRAAHAAGVDSVDGTHLCFRPDRYLPAVWGWLDAVNGQAALEDAS